jgi:hypothetical protein
VCCLRGALSSHPSFSCQRTRLGWTNAKSAASQSGEYHGPKPLSTPALVEPARRLPQQERTSEPLRLAHSQENTTGRSRCQPPLSWNPLDACRSRKEPANRSGSLTVRRIPRAALAVKGLPLAFGLPLLVFFFGI